jgi:hypothetical protein
MLQLDCSGHQTSRIGRWKPLEVFGDCPSREILPMSEDGEKKQGRIASALAAMNARLDGMEATKHIKEGLAGLATRITYCSFFVFWMVVAFIMSRDFFGLLHYIPTIVTDNTSACFGASGCYGKLAVYRISFVVFSFFALSGLLMSFPSYIRKGDWRHFIHNKLFILKALAILVAVVLTFFLPNILFLIFGYASMVGGGVFLVIQAIILVDFAYQWNEKWVSYDKWYFYAGLLVISAALYVASGVVQLSAIWYDIYTWLRYTADT